MGGAQRSQRQRQQRQRQSAQAARAVAAARGRKSNRNKTIAGIVVVVVIAVAIIGGVLITNGKKQAQINSVIPAAQATHDYPTKVVDGSVIVAGKDSAKIKIEMYEDFICPACEQTYRYSHEALAEALANGQIQARIHMLPFLDQNSNPPGYSGRAASASVAAAANGGFADFYNSLYAKQPDEGSAGYTNDQLINLGERLHIGGSFADDVRNGKYVDEVNADFTKARKDLSNLYHGGFATPTILYNGKPLDVLPRQNRQTGELTPPPPWVKDLINGKVDAAPVSG